MIFAGVDPGKAGAIAFLDEHGRVVELVSTPMIVGPKVKGRGGKMRRSAPDYDVDAIARIFRRRANPRLPPGNRGLFVTIEKLQLLPPSREERPEWTRLVTGAKANIARGEARAWRWMLAAFGIPYAFVLPRVWQHDLLAGMPGDSPKAKSIAAARLAWPGLRIVGDGHADSLWLAEHGRRKHLGGDVFAAAARATSSAPSEPR